MSICCDGCHQNHRNKRATTFSLINCYCVALKMIPSDSVMWQFWQAACDPSLCSSILERHCPNLAPEFQPGMSKGQWEHILRTEAGSRKLGSFVLHVPLISGTKGPAVSAALWVHMWEAGGRVLSFLWRTLCDGNEEDTAVANRCKPPSQCWIDAA